MKNLGLPARIGIYLIIAIGLGALGYFASHSLTRAGILALLALIVGGIFEGSTALQNRGVLPELHYDDYGVQTPSWYEKEQEKKASESGEAVESDG